MKSYNPAYIFQNNSEIMTGSNPGMIAKILIYNVQEYSTGMLLIFSWANYQKCKLAVEAGSRENCVYYIKYTGLDSSLRLVPFIKPGALLWDSEVYPATPGAIAHIVPGLHPPAMGSGAEACGRGNRTRAGITDIHGSIPGLDHIPGWPIHIQVIPGGG